MRKLTTDHSYVEKLIKEGKITREEAASIIANITNLSSNSNFKFTDDSKISNWAKPSVYALAENKIMGGYENGAFRPKNKITRAEAVVTLSRVK